MKLIGAQFRTSLAREAALQNQLDRQAQAAADREEVRNFEESGISKFHFDPDGHQAGYRQVCGSQCV